MMKKWQKSFYMRQKVLIKKELLESHILLILQVATYLADLSMDVETVVSAVCDLIEDTDVTFKDIKNLEVK